LSAFTIHTHGRLHEWIAEEKGYYAAEGLPDLRLEKNFLGAGLSDPAFVTDEGWKFGAYESYEAGRESTTSCATPLRYGFLSHSFDATNAHAPGVI